MDTITLLKASNAVDKYDVSSRRKRENVPYKDYTRTEH